MLESAEASGIVGVGVEDLACANHAMPVPPQVQGERYGGAEFGIIWKSTLGP